MSTIVKFGEDVDGYDIPVLNEREIRAAAGLLFLMMFTAIVAAVLFDRAGARRYATVAFEASAVRADRETMKPDTFWRDAGLAEALSRFERAGGTVIRPR